MNLPADAVAAVPAAAAGTGTPLYNLRLLLPHPFANVISGENEFNDIWFLLGPERDDDWNLWIQAINRDWPEETLGPEWVVCRTAWWWGEFIDEWDF